MIRKLLRKIFSHGDFHQEKKTDSSIFHDAKSETFDDNLKLSELELAFLNRAARRTLEELSYWKDLAGIDPMTMLKRLHDQGLLKPAELPDFLEALKTTELKQLLRKHGLKVSGRKNELVRRLLESVPKDELLEEVKSFLKSTNFYVLTSKGNKVAEQYKNIKREEREQLQVKALELLEREDLQGAVELIKKYESAQIFKNGLGIDWKEGPFPETLAAAKYLLSYSYSDLKTDEHMRRKVAAILAFGELMGESIDEIGKKIAALFPEDFPCPSLKRWLLKKPDFYMVRREFSSNIDTIKGLATLYAHTYLFRAQNRARLDRLKEFKLGIGIKIDVIDDCPICNSGTLTVTWAELDKLPELPRHWGVDVVIDHGKIYSLNKFHFNEKSDINCFSRI